MPERKWTVELTGWNPENESVEDSITVVADSADNAETKALPIMKRRSHIVEVGDVKTYPETQYRIVK